MDPNQLPQMSIQNQQDLVRKKHALEVAFKEFHELVSVKVLKENKSPQIKDAEKQVVGRLIQAAIELEQVNVGEGIISLVSVAIREHLAARDRINEIEYKLYKLMRDVKQMQKDGGKNDSKKE